MRFTENCDNDLELNSSGGFIKSVASLIVIAPFHLIHEISLKMVFIKKDLVQKVFFVAIGTGVIFCLFDLFSSFFISYSGTFLTDDFLIYASSTVIISLLSTVYRNANSMVYEQLERMFVNEQTAAKTPDKPDNTVFADSVPKGSDTSAGSVVSAGVVAGGSTVGATAGGTLTHLDNTRSEIKEVTRTDNYVQPKVAGTESNAHERPTIAKLQSDPVSSSSQSIDIAVQNELADFANRYQNSVAELQKRPAALNCGMTETEADRFEKELEECTDPSRYISDELIKAFDRDAEKEDLSFLADLDLSIIPETFNILA